MKNLLTIVLAVAILAALHFTGVISTNNITHPVWNFNALVFGGLGGVIFTVLKYVFSAGKPALENNLSAFVNIVFGLSLASTLYFSYRFTNAESFDLFAADVWHWSSYTVIGSFIPQVSQLLKKLLTRQ